MNLTSFLKLQTGHDHHGPSAIYQHAPMDKSLSDYRCPRSKQVNQQSRDKTNQKPIYYGAEVAGHSLKANVSLPSQRAIGLV